MTAHCFRCKGPVVMAQPKRVVLKNGRAAVQDSCPTCKTKLSKIVKA